MRAVVTGGSSGIGKAVVRELHNRRAIIAYDLSRSTGVDVTDSAQVHRAYDVFGGPAPELLVASAGIGAPGVPFPDDLHTDWWRVLETNVLGVYICAREHVSRLRDEGRPGRIVLIGSPSAKRPSLENLAYGVSKAAVQALGLGLARGLERDGIKVYILCPSHVDTPMLRGRGFTDLQERKLLEPSYIGKFIADLLLEDNALDGQVIHMGGEVRMKQE